MCTPVAAGIVMGVTSMASQAMAIKSQQQSMGQEAAVNAANAVAEARATMASLQVRRKQEATRVSLDQVRRYAQGRRERSTILTRSADALGGGASTVRDMVASVIQEEIDLGTLETSKEWADNQLVQEQIGAANRAVSGISQSQAHLDSRPGGFASVLQVIGAGVSGYSQGVSLGQGMSSGRARRHYKDGNTKTTE
jgi:hypothetical protein